jgi:hypothetical protein
MIAAAAVSASRSSPSTTNFGLSGLGLGIANAHHMCAAFHVARERTLFDHVQHLMQCTSNST